MGGRGVGRGNRIQAAVERGEISAFDAELIAEGLQVGLFDTQQDALTAFDQDGASLTDAAVQLRADAIGVDRDDLQGRSQIAVNFDNNAAANRDLAQRVANANATVAQQRQQTQQLQNIAANIGTQATTPAAPATTGPRGPVANPPRTSLRNARAQLSAAGGEARTRALNGMVRRTTPVPGVSGQQVARVISGAGNNQTASVIQSRNNLTQAQFNAVVRNVARGSNAPSVDIAGIRSAFAANSTAEAS